jgi:hypothetical protein
MDRGCLHVLEPDTPEVQSGGEGRDFFRARGSVITGILAVALGDYPKLTTKFNHRNLARQTSCIERGLRVAGVVAWEGSPQSLLWRSAVMTWVLYRPSLATRGRN